MPLLAWKVISDSADANASRDFAAFVKSYKGEGGALVAEFLRALPSDPTDVDGYGNLKKLLEPGR